MSTLNPSPKFDVSLKSLCQSLKNLKKISRIMVKVYGFFQSLNSDIKVTVASFDNRYYFSKIISAFI